MQCEKKTNNKNAICNKCEELRGNRRLNEAFKAERATSTQLGLSGAFNGDGTFTELVALMVFAGLLVQRIRQIRRTDSIIITNPDLVLENFMKF
ncbi:unnamed protein product [Rhizophagus irregularis]|nr:unnamed protein product [Rhizophagus irregularis]